MLFIVYYLCALKGEKDTFTDLMQGRPPRYLSPPWRSAGSGFGCRFFLGFFLQFYLWLYKIVNHPSYSHQMVEWSSSRILRIVIKLNIKYDGLRHHLDRVIHPLNKTKQKGITSKGVRACYFIIMSPEPLRVRLFSPVSLAADTLKKNKTC